MDSSITVSQIFEICTSIFIFILFVCYLFIKFYKITCKKLGIAGNVKKSTHFNKKIFYNPIKITFITQTSKTLPWIFKCNVEYIKALPGEIIKINYKAKNTSSKYSIGEATYNVTPLIASKYFIKIQCFCFKKIIIPPNTNFTLPLVFYIEPTFSSKEETKNIKELTLIYIINNINP
ncbi:cytochrome c oxidase assembly protein [Wolbachia endosymbiont of Tettigetta isshikii]|uniref:cytochrome c oxidase assembly protein n=1 Tax=Wolbachia endosymbiont of Tettigetta isshikii TaxID=3239093 RepID=UPI003980074D